MTEAFAIWLIAAAIGSVAGIAVGRIAYNYKSGRSRKNLLKLGSGAWIFVSHSNKDIDKVCRVRDVLEQWGHHPLMFFLKSVEDDDSAFDLIENEIRARSWFVLCDSRNARRSTWVQREKTLIKSLPKHNYTFCEVNLDDPDLDIDAKIQWLNRRATVCLSYHPAESALAKQIMETLSHHDFSVYAIPEPDNGGAPDWTTYSFWRTVADVASVLVLISPNSIREPERQIGLGATATLGSHVISVYTAPGLLGDQEIPVAVRRLAISGSRFQLDPNRFADSMRELMIRLRTDDWLD